MCLVFVVVDLLDTVVYHDHDDLVRHYACLVKECVVTLLNTLMLI